LSIEQEVRGTIIEARYVGSHATKVACAGSTSTRKTSPPTDFFGFCQAQNNGFLALKQNGVFKPGV